MKYNTLKKLYYGDNEIYNNTYKCRFESEDAIYLDIAINKNPAFLLQTSEVSNIIIEIYKIDRGILELKRNLPGVALDQFAKRCLIDEIVLTNDIEGVSSTRKEIGDVLDEISKRETKRRFYGLVQKYLMLQYKSKLSLTSCRDIRNIYDELVLKEVIEESKYNEPDGEIFRKDSVSVYNRAQKEIHKGLYPESEIIKAMDMALKFLNRNEVQPLIRIAVFHYLVGYIHPFYDGNGRLDRFISSYLLSQELDPFIGYRLSYTIKQEITDYYGVFKICNSRENKGDLTPFVIVFLKIILKAIKQLENALKERLVLLTKYSEIAFTMSELKNDKFNLLVSLLIQAALFSEEGISTEELLDIVKISRSTLSNRLSFLKQKDLIEISKTGKVKYYKINLEKLVEISKKSPPTDE